MRIYLPYSNFKQIRVILRKSGQYPIYPRSKDIRNASVFYINNHEWAGTPDRLALHRYIHPDPTEECTDESCVHLRYDGGIMSFYPSGFKTGAGTTNLFRRRARQLLSAGWHPNTNVMYTDYSTGNMGEEQTLGELAKPTVQNRPKYSNAGQYRHEGD